MITDLFRRLSGENEFDRLLRKAAKDGRKKFLIMWNRGLGDIALGLYALTERIKSFVPDAELSFIARKELEDALGLLGEVRVISVPWWGRGEKTDFDGTLGRLGIKRTDYDVILEKTDPTKWLSWQIGTLTPRLRWRSDYDGLWKRFGLKEGASYIGVHVNSETQQFYNYRKDWPAGHWRLLFERLSGRPDTNIILFGLNSTDPFDFPSVTDLRGKTSLLEMLSIIKNRCAILVAPDSGVLSITYYLDVYFPITVISLWGDPGQGILKQAVASPNKGFRHFPLKGTDKDVARISVDEVFSLITGP